MLDLLSIAADHCLKSEDSFFLADFGRVVKQFELWNTHLPAVRPFYAVKCNPDPNLLGLLAQLGSGFDCASIAEMHLALATGVRSKDIIFANPCKAPSALAFAAREGLTTTTFDNHSELEKIKILMPNARLLLRIYANDPTALVPLGDKFGATRCSVASLLHKAHALGLNVVGISFHVGSGASDLDSLRAAIESARYAWDLAESLHMPMEILDIGGGFQSSSKSFISMATAVKEAIARARFPAHTKLIAEPGRFFAKDAYTLFTQVISLRENDTHEQPCRTSCSWQHMLYQNDGVYKSFMNRIIEKEEFHPILVPVSRTNNVLEEGTHTYSIWGPTCDSTDLISRRAAFPCRVQVGDWLMYENMGAYTLSTATRFNGFSDERRILYVNNLERDDEKQTWNGNSELSGQRLGSSL
ncbi:uncharacterized protein MYCGRDRAFT_44322 [Zymoseptoria tritici IPO323]|uniref:ornithine decarboxylase n=1 Tax=Zymoseptoria tritici (strain CBS 115943 / IPO323) TaxID=336722 RepID=F9XEJ5_ZYMTI|nr:uncharacterized protein MYCGRDRAFT_44322 [Zymoseptoria tritici IPO323]EGP86635.1 hypothetical protein MYCGRDRAFT_44322 [Zymoseptoria tritici IPO323]